MNLQTRKPLCVPDQQGNLHEVAETLTPFLKTFLVTPCVEGGVHITLSPENVPNSDHLPRSYESYVDSKVLALLTFVFPIVLEFIIWNQWTYNPELTDDSEMKNVLTFRPTGQFERI